MTEKKISDEDMKSLLNYLNIYNSPKDPVQKRLQTEYYNKIYLPRVSGAIATDFLEKALELREKAKRAANKMRSHTIIGIDTPTKKNPEPEIPEISSLQAKTTQNQKTNSTDGSETAANDKNAPVGEAVKRIPEKTKSKSENSKKSTEKITTFPSSRSNDLLAASVSLYISSSESEQDPEPTNSQQPKSDLRELLNSRQIRKDDGPIPRKKFCDDSDDRMSVISSDDQPKSTSVLHGTPSSSPALLEFTIKNTDFGPSTSRGHSKSVDRKSAFSPSPQHNP